MERKEIRWVGYIRKPVWEDIVQRPQTRLYTGAAVYNLPHVFAEPEDDEEWLRVEVVLRVVADEEGQ